MLIFLLWGALYIGGCTDTPSDPGFDEMPPMEDVEIEMCVKVLWPRTPQGRCSGP